MKRKCWCGSQLDYHDCHEAFDKKLKQYKKHGYLIPNHKMIKNEKQIEAIKRAAVVNNGLLDYIEEHIQIGMTTQDIDDMAVAYTSSHGGYSADLNYEGYPKSICTSVNDEVCHGIPGDYVLQDGDIIQSRYAITKRDRTIHGRMREYLYFLTHSERFKTVVLPVGDGAALSQVIRADRKKE